MKSRIFQAAFGMAIFMVAGGLVFYTGVAARVEGEGLALIGPLVAGGAVALIMAWFVSRWLAAEIVAPLMQLGETPTDEDGYEELVPLLNRMAAQHDEITLQKVQLTLQQNEFQSVIDHMKEGLVLLNKDGRILLMNRSARELLDIEEGAGGSKFIQHSTEDRVQVLLKKAFKGKNARDSFTVGPCRYEIHASPVISDDEIQGVVLFYLDVTEKMEAEQFRREFSANVSHELKTPLHSISGCAELMLNDMVKEADKQQFLQQIYDEAQHMIDLVNNTITISKMDEAVETLPIEAVDLYSLAQSVVAQLLSSAKLKNVQLEVVGVPVVIGGVHLLLQELIYNLCDNAIKYTPEGGSVIVSVAKNKNEAILKVKDTGCGIPEEQQERVFERFYRVDKSHSRTSGGSGLGLSIVKHAVAWHDGTIKLKSKVGKGTTMTVRFPLKKKNK